jgi:hypothetical protein
MFWTGTSGGAMTRLKQALTWEVALPNNYTPNLADLGMRATSVLRKELTASLTALRATPRATSATPQVSDFAGRLETEVNQAITQLGHTLLQIIDSTLIQLLNLASITGVVLASVPTNITAGQSGTGTFVLSNLGTNPVPALELIASQLTTLSGSSDSIDPAQVTFTPNPVSIPPRGSTTVTVQVAVPSGQVPDNYYGSILDAASGQVRGLLSIGVIN